MKLTNLCYTKEHIKTLASWFHSQWGYLYPERTLDCVEKELSKNSDSTTMPTTFVGLIDNAPVATAALTKCDMETHAQYSPWLASVYVDEDQRKQGYGNILVNKVLEHAKELGYKNIYLFTPDQEKWYQKMGWQPFEQTIYHNEQVHIMRYDLASCQT